MATFIEPSVLPAARELHSAVAENFSLTRGGPIYRLQLRLGRAREERMQAVWRALGVAIVTWLPLLLLSAAQGMPLGIHPQISVLQDFAVSVRFLIAVPLLIISEVGIDQRLRVAVNYFLKSGLVTEAGLPAFEGVIERVTRLRDRLLPEVVILILACLQSLTHQGTGALLGTIPSWHVAPTATGQALSDAGWWFSLISMPVYRFLLLRWVWRMYLWASFLWHVSKVNLVLIPTHPDLAAGLGFLSRTQRQFGLIVFAMGAVVAGQLENSIAYSGGTVAGLKFVIISYWVCATLILVAPLLVLLPTLVAIKKRGLFEYGALAAGYTRAFDAKWVHGSPPPGEALLGSSDIQSLADLGNSFNIVREMRPALIDSSTLASLALTAALPMFPVLIFGTPADQLIQTLLKLVA